MAASDIKSTIEQNVTNKALTLASDTFTGPFQEAVQYFLSGITIPIGSEGSLTVSNDGLNFSMAPVTVTGTTDNATVTVKGTGNLAGASITAKFTKDGNNVIMEIEATMGDTLKWELKELWPSLSIMNSDPFSALALENGSLSLTYDSGAKKITFLGTGTIDFNDTPFLNGVVKVIYTGSTSSAPDQSNLGVLLGVVVTDWSPGTIWSALDEVTFRNSGLVFSSIDDATTLSTLNLISGTDVPSIVTGDFKVTSGISFFTTLELDGFLEPLTLIIGQQPTLALFAHKSSGADGALTIQALFGAGSFKPNDNAIFEFEGFTLEWDMEGANYTLSATASGKFQPGDESLGLDLSGTIKPSEGDIELSIAIDNWEKPFGWESLTIEELKADISLGGGSEGVTIGMEGAFEFKVDSTESFLFDVGVEITDFELPTGVAFAISEESPGKELSIGDMIEGITSLNVNSNDVFKAINKIIQIENIAFAVVESSSITFDYPKKLTFPKGFTLQADFDLFQVENIAIDVEISTSEFTAKASMAQAVKFGNYLTLSRSSSDQTQGPEIAISSKGTVVDGINDNNPVYFYTSGYVSLFDFVSVDVYGLVTTEGLVRFTEQASVNGGGVFGGEKFYVGIDPNQLIFEAGFAFEFGWTNLSVGPIELFDVQIIPQITLPNFDVSAGLGVDMNGVELSFTLTGELQFDFLGLSLNYGSYDDMKTIFSIDLGAGLSGGPTTQDDLKDKIWDKIKEELEGLLKAAFKVFEEFLSWAKQALTTFAKDIANFAENVAKYLKNAFDKATEDIAKALSFIGCEVDQIADALEKGLGIAAEKAKEFAEDAFKTVKKCASESATALI